MTSFGSFWKASFGGANTVKGIATAEKQEDITDKYHLSNYNNCVLMVILYFCMDDNLL